jgi:hypothetical protein
MSPLYILCETAIVSFCAFACVCVIFLKRPKVDIVEKRRLLERQRKIWFDGWRTADQKEQSNLCWARVEAIDRELIKLAILEKESDE